MRWSQSPPPTLGAALFATLLVISGCNRTAPSPPPGLLASRDAQRTGAVLFAAHCAICHGDRGEGQGLRGAFMYPPPANLTLPPWSEIDQAGRTFLAVRNGVAGTAMAGWPSLSDKDVWDLVAYITSQKTK